MGFGSVSGLVMRSLLIRGIALDLSVTGACTGFYSSQAQEHMVSLIRLAFCIMEWRH